MYYLPYVFCVSLVCGSLEAAVLDMLVALAGVQEIIFGLFFFSVFAFSIILIPKTIKKIISF